MYERDPRDLSAAVTEIIEEIGWRAAEKATGKAQSTMEKWKNPTRPEHPSFDQCIALDAAYERVTGERGLIISLYAERLSHESMSDLNNAPDIEEAALDLGIAVGKVIETAKHATHEDSDGGKDITPREFNAGMRCVHMLRRSASRMEDSFKARLIDHRSND